MCEIDLDWVLDFYEGFEFNISYEFGEGKKWLVGISLIYESDFEFEVFVKNWLLRINEMIVDLDWCFMVLICGLIEGSWVRVCMREFGV